MEKLRILFFGKRTDGNSVTRKFGFIESFKETIHVTLPEIKEKEFKGFEENGEVHFYDMTNMLSPTFEEVELIDGKLRYTGNTISRETTYRLNEL